MNTLKRKDILYPELSFQIIGVLFEVSNKMGYQFQEKYYQKAIAALFQQTGIKFKEQLSVPLMINGKKITTGRVDFLIEEKIILEIKRGDVFLKQNIDQLNSYLKMADLELGILANFTSHGLQFKRILNIKNHS